MMGSSAAILAVNNSSYCMSHTKFYVKSTFLWCSYKNKCSKRVRRATFQTIPQSKFLLGTELGRLTCFIAPENALPFFEKINYENSSLKICIIKKICINVWL